MRSGWRTLAACTAECAVPGEEDGEARVLEVVARQLGDLGFVVDDEDGRHRVVTLVGRGRWESRRSATS